MASSYSFFPQVSEIRRENSIFTEEAIHCFSELKIPLPSGSQSPTPQGSPVLSRRTMAGALESHPGVATALDSQIVSAGVEHTPRKIEASSCQQDSLLEVDSNRQDSDTMGVRSITSMLSAADLQLKASHEFAKKLQMKK